MKAVFADAFYFVALINRADQHHRKAVAAAQQLVSPIVTTEWVLAEVADALAGSASRAIVPRFIADLQKDANVSIVSASGQLFQRGLELYKGRPDKKWSLTDCMSFVVMKDEDIREALTGDDHFRQAGFIVLLR